jgi:AAA domain
LLAGPNGTIAAIDTEQGSLSKYAHTEGPEGCGGPGVCADPSHFDFSVLEMKSFSPELFTAALKVAEANKFDVFCCDSLSHFWMGKDGALEFVDQAGIRNKDGFAGWKAFRPHERAMVDQMIASPCHVICTMRTKTDYQEIEVNGKKKRVKIGLAPVQREGLEYEFDLVGYMDDENNLIVDKTRCSALSGKVLNKPSAESFEVFRAWLGGAKRPAAPAQAPGQQQAQRPAATLPQAAQPPVQHTGPFEYSPQEGRLQCQPTKVERHVSRNNNPYAAVTLNGECEGKPVAYCFHASILELVLKSAGKLCEFKVELEGNYLMINDVIAMGGVKYIDGFPQRAPGVGVANDGTLINDDDIPF